MADILFLAHRIPYPPNKGDKIRSWNVLRYLAERHRVRLGCFIDDPADWAYCGHLRALCADSLFVPLDPRWAKLRSLRGLLTGQPLSLPYYADRRMRDWVNGHLRAGGLDVAFGFSSVMGQYLLGGAAAPLRRLMDFIDVDSDKWRQYAASTRWPMAAIYAREARRLATFEKQVAAAFDHSLFVSAAEAQLFNSMAPGLDGKVHALENGVDTAYFDPDCPVDTADCGGAPVAVFTGAMDYWANVDAVCWFAEAVWPHIRARHAGARFYIVGGKPAPAVKALESEAGIVVTGRVDDVRPYLKAAAVAVAPMRIARGVQNKVLEAMAMGKAVVTTSQGLEGIAAEVGLHVLAADQADGFAAAVLDIIGQPDRASRMGQAARRHVVARYGWQARLAPLDDWIGAGLASADNTMAR